MKVATTRFGEMELADDLIIQMPEGILGFPDDRRYVVLEHDAEGAPFKWLQSVDTPELAFIVIDPRHLVDNFILEFDEDSRNLFGDAPADEFVPMAIVNVPAEEPIKMTANLRAPIVAHVGRRLARQVVLDSEDYSLHHRIFAD
jgi:flagellar assembly factor FliW